MTSVIVVDDNEDELKYSLKTIKSSGWFHKVIGFNSPEDACFYAEKNRIDILFMAIQIKGLNCFILMEKIRKIKPDIFYVIITTNNNHALEAFQKGVMDYVLKPISLESVGRVVEKIKRYQKRDS